MKKYKFSWDYFKEFNEQEKLYALHNYLLNTNAITNNLFLIVSMYKKFFAPSKLKEVYTELSKVRTANAFTYNFKKVMQYCSVYKFYGM